MDTEAKGYLDIEEAKSYFTRHGEAFAQVITFFTNFAAFSFLLRQYEFYYFILRNLVFQEEIDEMLNAAVDANTKTIPYRTFVHFLTIEPND